MRRRGQGRRPAKHLTTMASGELLACGRCQALFAKPGDQGKAAAALIWHKKTCGELWDSSITFSRIKSKCYWTCPFCMTKLAHHQAPRFLLKLVEQHVKMHVARVQHTCTQCRSPRCTG